MPLTHGSSDEDRSKNIGQLIRDGYDKDQAAAIAYNIQRESRGKSYNWHGAEKLNSYLENLMKEVITGSGAEIEMNGGLLIIDKGDDGKYYSQLVKDESVIHRLETDAISNIVTALIAGGLIAPVCSDDNKDHIDALKDTMNAKLEMSMGNDFLDEDEKKERLDTPEATDAQPGTNADYESAGLKNSEDVDQDHNDEEILNHESQDDFEKMSDDDKKQVEMLLDKHDSQQPPQINEYPGGGYEVRIFANNGLYYYYLITESHEVVYLATMGKSMTQKQKWPNLVDIMKKSNPKFEQNFHFFKNSEQLSDSSNLIKFLGVADDKVVMPEVTDYETGRGYNLTTTVRDAIIKLADEKMCSIYSVTNNNDSTYRVVFKMWPSMTSVNQQPKYETYDFDRDGNATRNDGADVVIMKSKPFAGFNFTKTADQLFAEKNKSEFTVKESVQKSNSKVLDESFFTVDENLSEHEKMVLESQSQVIKGHNGKKLSW